MISEITNIYRNAFINLIAQYRVIFRALLIPTLCLLLFRFEVLPQIEGKYFVRIASFVYLCFYAFLFLLLFRILINGPTVLNRWLESVISKSTVYFILYVVCFLIVFHLLSLFVFSLISYPVSWVIFSLIKVCLIARIILVFPAISVNEYFSFTSSWRRTKRHQSLMIIISLTVVLLREFSKSLSDQLFAFTNGNNYVISFFEVMIWGLIVALIAEVFKLIQMKNNASKTNSQKTVVI